jgi:hypothetical protein
MRAVLRGEQEADVPCDGCVGCCVSAYPIPLRPDDRAALQLIPEEFLQWPTPGGGLARMRYRADGSCPMLRERQCTIYRDRPRTCRDYDCRLYAAAGLEPDGMRPVIQERVREWQFEFADALERAQADAVRQAAAFIRDHAAAFPAGVRAHSATAAGVLAVKVWQVFVDREVPAGAPGPVVLEVLEAARQFDAGKKKGP